MNREEQRTLRDIIRRHAGSTAIYELSPEEDLVEALHLDSLTALEVLAAVEKEFDVMLPDEKLHELRTLSRIQAEIRAYEEEFGRTGDTTCASD